MASEAKRSRGGVGIEPQARPRAGTECDRAELLRVFVHPGARDPKVPRELARVEGRVAASRASAASASSPRSSCATR